MASERVQRQIDRLLDEIEAAVEQRNWELVRELAGDVLDFAPDNDDAKSFLSTAERALSRSSGRSTSETATLEVEPPPTSPAEALTPEHPTSFASGRYEVKRFLGEGGKKVVYLAHDTTLDRDVAFALIKTEGLDQVGRTRIAREAQAMGRLGSHPHIVTVFDMGQDPSTGSGQAQPYMVTELMAGGGVEGAIEEAPDHKLPMERAVEVAVHTCRGLMFAHDRGVVHRDLKPGNVWLTSDGTAKIGDFGLAVAVDRSRLTADGMPGTTPDVFVRWRHLYCAYWPRTHWSGPSPPPMCCRRRRR